MQTRFRNIKFARLFGKIWQKREREIFVISPSLCLHHPLLTSYKTNINQIHVYFKTISQYSIDQINASGCTNHDIKDSKSIKNTKLGLCQSIMSCLSFLIRTTITEAKLILNSKAKTACRIQFITAMVVLLWRGGGPWNNGMEVPRWGVAEIQKISPSTTGRCK